MAELFKRSTFVQLDQYGIDPLKDNAFELISQIETYTEYTVDTGTEENLPLIAYKNYGNKDLWWVIAVFNGVLDISELTPGSKLRLPNISELTFLLSKELNNGSGVTLSGGTTF